MILYLLFEFIFIEEINYMQRKSGVLLHISSLPGDYGCGSFGESAKRFIDFAADAGFSYWQTLPFCIPDWFGSPYSSVSTFSGNPNFIDLDILHSQGLLTKEELVSARASSPYACDFETLNRDRLPLLFRAAERAYKNPQTAARVDKYMESHPHVSTLCRFMAIKAHNGQRDWLHWDNENCDPSVERAWRFIEYEFFRQWNDIREYARKKNIKIIGDIPFYVSLDSSDVWGEPDQFQLDEERRPAWVAGVPPDYFSESGQLWGNPLYDWDVMKKDHFAFWRSRLSFMLDLYDGVRIDHFRAIESYYRIKSSEKTARNGEWKKGPGEDFIDMIQEVADGKLIIAEDLGDITDSVRKLLDYSGFPGMRVLQFGFINGGDSIHRPHNYINNCIAYTGTHDNNTTLGMIWEMPPERRDEMFEYCGCPGDWNSAVRRIVYTVLGSSAGLAVIPIQDLLGYGGDTRMNTPGVANGSWRFRITADQLKSINTSDLRRMNEIYARYR